MSISGNNSINGSTASMIAAQLDAKDGSADNKISQNIWNEFWTKNNLDCYAGKKEQVGKDGLTIGQAINFIMTRIYNAAKKQMSSEDWNSANNGDKNAKAKKEKSINNIANNWLNLATNSDNTRDDVQAQKPQQQNAPQAEPAKPEDKKESTPAAQKAETPAAPKAESKTAPKAETPAAPKTEPKTAPKADNSPKAEAENADTTADNTSEAEAENAGITTVQRKNPNSDIRFPKDSKIDPELYAQAVDNVIRDARGERTDSVMLGTGKYFHQAAKNNNVDPFTLAAVSMFESTYGTSRMAKRQKNPSGITPDGKHGTTYSDVSGAIDQSAKTLSRNAQRHSSISNIGKHGNYCCGTTGERWNWANGVSSISNKIRNEYNRLVNEKNNSAQGN